MTNKLLSKMRIKNLIAVGDTDSITRENAILFTDLNKYLYELNSYQVINNSPKPFHIGNKYCIHNLNIFLEKNKKPYKAVGICIKKRDFVFECITCGHQLVAQASYVVRLNTGCAKCSNKVRLTIDEIKNRVKSEYSHIEILSDDSEYKNCESKLKCRCSIHNIEFHKTYDKIKQGKYVCPECYNDSRKGENNPSWKGGITELSAYMRTAVKDWWNMSVKESNYKCSITGLSGDIEVHHLNKTFNQILQEALGNTGFYELNNSGDYSSDELNTIKDEVVKLHNKYGFGVVLNKKIHKAFHYMYGSGDNTKEQFEEFLQYIKDDSVMQSILGDKDFKNINIIKEGKMIKQCKKAVICNETMEIFDSLADVVRRYKDSEGISSSTLVNHLKRGSKFRKCKYTFKYYEQNIEP